MEFMDFFNTIRERIIHTNTDSVDGRLAIMIHITGEPEGTFYIEVKDGILSVEPYEYNDRDVAITISAEHFMKLMDKKADPIVLFTLGKIKTEGDVSKALMLKQFL